MDELLENVRELPIDSLSLNYCTNITDDGLDSWWNAHAPLVAHHCRRFHTGRADLAKLKLRGFSISDTNTVQRSEGVHPAAQAAVLWTDSSPPSSPDRGDADDDVLIEFELECGQKNSFFY